MTMTKTEMVDKLNEAGLGTKTALKKLEPGELETMVAKLGDAETVEPTNETSEETTEDGTETPGEDVVANEDAAPSEDESTEGDTENAPNVPNVEPEEVEILLTTQHQLGIFTEYIYNVKNKGAKVKVENLGNGDAYVSDETPSVGNKQIRLFTGESKVFEGVTVVRSIAASQPEIQITEIK